MTNYRQLGLGLIGIGRKWGHGKADIPSEEISIRFLKAAFNLGISFYDTAPAYGFSEERLGNFLRLLSAEARDKITVAPKFGEHWDFNNNCSFVDHSYRALCNSIDQSIEKLERIDILQLHKTILKVLDSKELTKAIDYAIDRGIKSFGASVSDVESGLMVCRSDVFKTIQIPYNVVNTSMERVFDVARDNNKFVIINRPFDSGKLLCENNKGDGTFFSMIKYFQFILSKDFNGVILTGTTSISHLNNNLKAYVLAATEGNPCSLDEG